MNYAVVGDMQRVDTLSAFVMAQVKARGRINLDGANFFETCVKDNGARLEFSPPHGCYEILEEQTDAGTDPTKAHL